MDTEISRDWAWLQPLIGAIDDDFAEAATEEPAAQERLEDWE